MNNIGAAVGSALNDIRGAAADIVAAVTAAAKAAAAAKNSAESATRADAALTDARNKFEAAADSCMSSLNDLSLAAWSTMDEGDAELANVAHAAVDCAKAALNDDGVDMDAAAVAVAEAAQATIAALVRMAASGGASAAVESLTGHNRL